MRLRKIKDRLIKIKVISVFQRSLLFISSIDRLDKCAGSFRDDCGRESSRFFLLPVLVCSMRLIALSCWSSASGNPSPMFDMSDGLKRFIIYEDYRSPIPVDYFLYPSYPIYPRDVTLRAFGPPNVDAAVPPLGGSDADIRPATCGVGFGWYGFSVGLNAGIDGPVGGTI